MINQISNHQQNYQLSFLFLVLLGLNCSWSIPDHPKFIALKSIPQLFNCTPPAAPTGEAQQTLCEGSTVSDLAVTGSNIQWYDAATGGNLLAPTTALINGQIVYASQTVNGCESTDRLEVTVSIQDLTITASATDICAGESVNLSIIGDVDSTYLWSTGESIISNQGTLIGEYSLIANTVSQNTFTTTPGNNYRLEVSGTISLGGGDGNQRDVAYYIQGNIEGTPFNSACNTRIWTSLFCNTPGLRPSPDIYDPSTHTYNYPFIATSSTLDVGFFDSVLGDNAPKMVTFRLYELSNSESTITVNPTQTTDYWVDVTSNGVTCREQITINVTTPIAPTGDAQQFFCSEPLTSELSVNGQNITWYDAPAGGNVILNTQQLAGYSKVYASQTVNGCESSDRLEVTIYIIDPEVTASDYEICEGESVQLGASIPTPTVCDMDITLTNIPLGDPIPGFTYGGFYGGHYYYVGNSPSSWTVGEQLCRDNGGYLVCINDLAENTFVSNLTTNNIWIGLFRDPATCQFRWLDCIDINYTNWRSGEPNSGPCGEPYTQIIRGCSFGYNTWNNLSNNASNGSCYSNMVPIMEIDPTIYNTIPPSTTISYLWSTGDATPNIDVTPSTTTTYWVDVTANNTTCRETMTIIVNNIPNSPLTGGNITECATNALPNLIANATVYSGETIEWYDAPTGGNQVTNPELNTIGAVTYFAEAVNQGGCVSANRTPVTLTIHPSMDQPISNGDIEECALNPVQTLTATAIVPAGDIVEWYDAPTGGNIVANPELNSIGSVTYYAESINSTTLCRSASRTPVTLTINATPDAPISNGDIRECVVFPAQTITASATSGANTVIEWYDAAVNGNLVTNPELSNVGSISYFAEAVDLTTGCRSDSRTEVVLTLIQEVTFNVVLDLEVCDDNTNDGIAPFDLTEQNNNISSNGTISPLNISYHTSLNEAENQINPLPFYYNSTTTTLYARIENNLTGCYVVESFNVIVLPSPQNSFPEQILECDDDIVSITPGNGFNSYLWSNGQTTESIDVTQTGVYDVRVTNNAGCEATFSFDVLISEPPVNVNIIIDEGSMTNNSIIIRTQGIGNYEYSIDGFNFQSSPEFNHVEAGTYEVIVRDINGCDSYTEVINIIGIPDYFTPNQDGYHDYWKPVALNIYPDAQIFIFDRYGKLLKQVSYDGIGWDGTFNGQPLPSSDYWYQIDLGNGRVLKGHFTLKR